MIVSAHINLEQVISTLNLSDLNQLHDLIERRKVMLGHLQGLSVKNQIMEMQHIGRTKVQIVKEIRIFHKISLKAAYDLVTSVLEPATL